MPVRKSVATPLTAAEKQEFQDAVWALKGERVVLDGLSTYDRYVIVHNEAMSRLCIWDQDLNLSGFGLRQRNAPHRGPAFLPWHREFLRRFELDLQRVSGNPNLGLPYWDWASDAADPDASEIWSLVGPGGTRANQFRVTQGRFSFDPNNPADPGNWIIVDSTGRPDGGLRRSVGLSPNPAIPRITLPIQSQIEFAKTFSDYDSPPWNDASGLLANIPVGFRNLLEGWVVENPNSPGTLMFGNGLHNRVHVWVGGSMGPGTSPNDPIFFLHHAFVDKIWADWEQQHPNSDYQPQSDGPYGHNWTDAMFPWNGVDSPEIVTVQNASPLGNVQYQ